MKVFLSHSSKDKGFVEAVASLLKPGTFELDSLTFDKGALNAQVIIEALRRSDLFCLFLSNASAASGYVNFETLIGTELIASGKISQFLTVCLEEEAFEKASANVKLWNVVRRVANEDGAARLIQGHLVAAAEKARLSGHPFVGRQDEIAELEAHATNHLRPNAKAVFVSGNFGVGRRSLAAEFYGRQFRHVGKLFPTIQLDPFAGLEELFRRVLSALRPSMPVREATTRFHAFAAASEVEKTRQIADLINSLVPSSEAAVIIDRGGMLTDSGSFAPEFDKVISMLTDRPHPPAILIAPRMVPRRVRRAADDVIYLGLKSLKRDDTVRLLGGLLKAKGLVPNEASFNALVSLTDSHPFNVYRMVEEIEERGVAAFLADPTEFIEWKHRQSSEYISRIDFKEGERNVLAVLKQLPELDFSAIVDALHADPQAVSSNLSHLSHLHIVEANGDSFSLSPPLQIAIERDKRLRLPKELQALVMKRLAESLSIRLDEGTAPISLVDSAVLATLESGGAPSEIAAALMLPSHQVWLAKRHYDQKHWRECIRFATEALRGGRRLSDVGFVGASRYLCLSASRLGDDQTFNNGISQLEAKANTEWGGSNLAFLKGFNLRFKGQLAEAEKSFRRAYELSPGNLHAARELAEVCLARGNLPDAEHFAREAYSHAPTNPYHLDTLISVLIRKHGRQSKDLAELDDLFEVLRRVGDEGGHSFYTTRRAEFEHLWGSNKKAVALIDEAVKKTDRIFEPRRLQALIYLKEGNKTKAKEAISIMREMVTSQNPDERRSNFRAYLETLAQYHIEAGEYLAAKEIYSDTNSFTDAERQAGIRNIEIAESFAKERGGRH
ncbi:toll/interleukin-1 receptor domain-containing protein [Pseudolabrys sp. FHR47]|uniref:toll/interleukin-1 receptor domain-containing protein n=1 Tax=Pseudolabrys sp. FHR47 TaxID=2562284 RepID=UPI0010BE5DFB|nr:toll/interleukin-1 receptor domain-containing protein [Pseudolabrys sp. FHR47]